MHFFVYDAYALIFFLVVFFSKSFIYISFKSVSRHQAQSRTLRMVFLSSYIYICSCLFFLKQDTRIHTRLMSTTQNTRVIFPHKYLVLFFIHIQLFFSYIYIYNYRSIYIYTYIYIYMYICIYIHLCIYISRAFVHMCTGVNVY